jgi:glycosyltransferase involved in cell wall biosynthesis
MVSQADLQRIVSLYKIDEQKVSVVPNGSLIRTSDLLNQEDRLAVRSMLGCESELVGIFLGSSFSANVESYRLGRTMLEAAGFNGTMLLVGSIAQAARHDWVPVNFKEVWLGFVSEEVRDVLLSSADFALHLMFAGAGTNLKLFDYMSAGVPIITNDFGRRGVEGDNWSLPGETVSELKSALDRIQSDPGELHRLAESARELARNGFDWSSIAKRFEKTILAAID